MGTASPGSAVMEVLAVVSARQHAYCWSRRVFKARRCCPLLAAHFEPQDIGKPQGRKVVFLALSCSFPPPTSLSPMPLLKRRTGPSVTVKSSLLCLDCWILRPSLQKRCPPHRWKGCHKEECGHPLLSVPTQAVIADHFFLRPKHESNQFSLGLCI